MDKKLGAIWPLDCHITIGITSRPLDQHGCDLGSQIMLHKGGEISQKNHVAPIFCHQRRFFQNISDISPRTDISLIYRRYFGDIYGNISSPIFLYEISCRLIPIQDISAIYRRYIPIFSSMVTTGQSSHLSIYVDNKFVKVYY